MVSTRLVKSTVVFLVVLVTILVLSNLLIFISGKLNEQPSYNIHVLPALVQPMDHPVILFWTNYFDKPFILGSNIQCGTNKQTCYITNDKHYLKNSSAVIFHGIASDLLSGITKAKSFPRPTKQVWVYMNRESPLHTHIKAPDNVFNWSMTYKLDSDVFFPYGMVHIKKENDSFDPAKNYLAGRTKFAFVVVSNCVGHRMKLYSKLKEHFDLEILGGCGKPCGKDCFSNVTQYKFYLAFENSLCTDYLSEKTYSQLQRGIVPVVLSGANLSNPRLVPPGSVIDANKFSTAAELAEYLKKVGNDPLLYNKFYEWKNHWKITGCYTLTGFCHVCEKLHEDSVISKSLSNDMKWYEDTDCKPYKSWS